MFNANGESIDIAGVINQAAEASAALSADSAAEKAVALIAPRIDSLEATGKQTSKGMSELNDTVKVLEGNDTSSTRSGSPVSSSISTNTSGARS